LHTENGKSLVLRKLATDKYTFFITKDNVELLPTNDVDVEYECEIQHSRRNSYLHVVVQHSNMSISLVKGCIVFSIGDGNCSRLYFSIKLSSKWWKMTICEPSRNLRSIEEVTRVNEADSLH
jgi:hypothetical protein